MAVVEDLERQNKDIYDFVVSCLSDLTTESTPIVTASSPRAANLEPADTSEDIATFFASLSDAATLLAKNQLSLSSKEPPGLKIPDENALLRRAAFLGQVQVVEECLDRGADVNCCDGVGRTSLHYAVAGGFTGVLEKLLKIPVKVDARDKKQWTALHIAVSKNQLECARLLLQAGADIQLQLAHNCAPCRCGKTLSSPIHFAAIQGNRAMSELLCDHGACVNDQDRSERRPLHYAAFRSKVDYVKWLLEKGAEVSALDIHRRSALHAAGLSGQIENARMLLESGSDVTQRDVWDMTPLHITLVRKNIQLADFLLQHGADKPESPLLSDLDTTIAATLAEGLQEPKRDKILRAVQRVGGLKCLQVYTDTMQVERNGGVLVKDGSRRRTAGGVFFTRLQSSVSQEEWDYIRQADHEAYTAARARNLNRAKQYEKTRIRMVGVVGGAATSQGRAAPQQRQGQLLGWWGQRIPLMYPVLPTAVTCCTSTGGCFIPPPPPGAPPQIRSCSSNRVRQGPPNRQPKCRANSVSSGLAPKQNTYKVLQGGARKKRDRKSVV